MKRQINRLLLAAILGSSALCITALSIEAQASPQAAEAHEIVATTYYNTFTRAHPVLKRVRSGDTVRTKTLDSSGRDEKGVPRGQPGNPLTGPFYVDGAELGDALAVRFTKVRMNRNWGYTVYRLGLFSLTPESIEGLYPNRYKEGLVIPGRANLVPWDIDLERQTVRLREPVSGITRLEFSAKPMVGCVGVAPAWGFCADLRTIRLLWRQSRLQRDWRGHSRHAAGLPSGRIAVRWRRACATG